jgi:hypothetical protein
VQRYLRHRTALSLLVVTVVTVVTVVAVVTRRYRS